MTITVTDKGPVHTSWPLSRNSISIRRDERLMKDKTSIVIAHHLATIVRADAIFVVKDSQLAERGTHDELLAAGGFYSDVQHPV